MKNNRQGKSFKGYRYIKDRCQGWPGNLPTTGEVHLSLGSKCQVQPGMGSYSPPLPSGDPSRRGRSKGSAECCCPAGRERAPAERWPGTLSFLKQGSGWEKP